MPHSIIPLDETFGTHGLGNALPDLFNITDDRVGGVEPVMGLDVPSPDPVAAPLPFESAPHVSTEPMAALDSMPAASHESPQPIDYPPHMSQPGPSPIDVAPLAGPLALEALDSAVNVRPETGQPMPLESAPVVGTAPLPVFDMPALPPVQIEPNMAIAREHPPLFDERRIINYDSVLFHSPHWMA